MVTPVDLTILKELAADADRPRKQIAAAVGISEPSLSKRISSLALAGTIERFTIDVKYRDLGYGLLAITLISLRDQTTGSVRSILSKIEEQAECIELYTCLGEWDICIKWMTPDTATLMSRINAILSDQPVAKSETITLGEVIRQRRGVPIAST